MQLIICFSLFLSFLCLPHPFTDYVILFFQQSFTSNWPKVLWLAIDESGVHLLEHRSRNVLCTYEYDYILNYSASITSLMIITGSTRKQSKIILNTTQVKAIRQQWRTRIMTKELCLWCFLQPVLVIFVVMIMVKYILECVYTSLGPGVYIKLLTKDSICIMERKRL